MTITVKNDIIGSISKPIAVMRRLGKYGTIMVNVNPRLDWRGKPRTKGRAWTTEQSEAFYGNY